MSTQLVTLPADVWTLLSLGTTPVVVQIQSGRARVRSIDTSNLAANPDFATDTVWAKGTGWTIAAGVAHSDGTQGADSDLSQTPGTALINTREYDITFDGLNISAGNVTPVIGDVEGTDRSTNATFLERVIAGAGTDIDIRADLDFVGDIDNVTVYLVPNDDVGFLIYGLDNNVFPSSHEWSVTPSLGIWAKAIDVAAVVAVEET